MEKENKAGEGIDEMHFGQFEKFGILPRENERGEKEKEKIEVSNSFFEHVD